ncbi:MAG: Rdx family protein, partial [SAR202 cluster bacterium]|nr:Rdx family protein [SAR202 cluster bacterium]
TAAWMASEMFAEGGKDVAIKMTPGVAGILQVYVDDEKIFDKKEEDGKFPDLPRVKQMRAVVRDRLEALVPADDN